MLLLQFSTSHYCRKARLALAYKKIPYRVENLTPGLHILKLKPLTGLTTVPVLLPELGNDPGAIADSSQIFKFLDQHCPNLPLLPQDPELQTQALMLEDWLDESIGTATRFVYYHFRAHEGKSIDPSWSSQAVIQVVRRQYGINVATVELAEGRLAIALEHLKTWQHQAYLVGNQLTVADLTAAALLSPLALIPYYRQSEPWLFAALIRIHQACGEALPPGLS
ncbi:MAG: glutathione S-transferase family protein [Oscillatoriales cyanobacterium RM1_1_9]|nr:glutathione S-transferase family protein [Oscillatoriales cyanobacterium SM2_3_0]NJO46362.1 glutathione S-transferase family protein [Oscillatoriales cyanobacterium RM2_1_1]NJO71234.1 glutathione S-transferase family protein [Oscillatoriales cyanobacterium RM1_1_9]